MRLVEGVAEIGDVDSRIERLGTIGAEYGCVITAFDARYLAGREHVAQATRLAKRAVRRGENVADDPAIEIILYAAGRRQIDRALELGVSTGEGPVVVRVEHEGNGWKSGNRHRENEHEREDTERDAAAAVERALGSSFEPAAVLGTYDGALIRGFFGITEAELAATDAELAGLVGERVALLDVEK